LRPALDLDRDGKLVGVEIIGATDVISTPVGKLDFSGELVGVKEAAELAGKDKANFLRYLASREDFPEPIVSLASGRYWLSAEIERYLRKEKAAG
jgi:predicted DNA-binding transcriptional regulator AlpA